MSLCVTLLLGIPVVLCLLYMFAAVRAHPRRVRRSRTKDAVSVLVIAGSGGHTAEILWLVRSLPAYYKVQDFLLAETDTTSEAPIRKLIGPTVRIHRVPRAREVGQSWFSSIFSTLRALASSVSFAIRLHPQLTTKWCCETASSPGITFVSWRCPHLAYAPSGSQRFMSKEQAFLILLDAFLRIIRLMVNIMPPASPDDPVVKL
uniref:UDP-N-acetylglucosamine transferase subunit ALG14 isoform X2 n=1 Tax=Myxine glutinosa TaxID=7769 RepID=UPI00358FB00E